MSLRVLLVEDDRELRAHAARRARRRGLRGAARRRACPRPGAAGACAAQRDGRHRPGAARPRPARRRRRGAAGRRCGASAAMPVIVISARQAEGHKIRLLDAGADDYLVKPFSLGELLARMRVALRHRGTARAAGADALRGTTACRSTWPGAPRAARRRGGAPDAHRVQAAGPAGAQRRARWSRTASCWPTSGAPELVEHTHYLRLYMGQLRAKLEADAGRTAPAAHRARRRLPAGRARRR